MPRTVDADRHQDLFMTKAHFIVRTVLWLALVVLMVSPLMLAGCSEESTGSGGSGNYVPRYLVESEPTRTLDGRYIFFCV